MPVGIYKRTEYHKKITSDGVKKAYNKGKIMGFQKGHIVNIGRECSEETKEKIGKNRWGKKNPNWKGNDIKYTSLHQWINRQLGEPNKCEHCGKEGLKRNQINWANKDHTYKRDLEDWISLCVGCHKKYDLKQGNEPSN